MSIEQRVSDALTDLQAELGNGIKLEEALTQIANDYELKAEVLRIRAEKALGDLNSVREVVEVRRAADTRRALLRSALVKYRLVSFGLTTPDDYPVPETLGAMLERDFEFSSVEPEGSEALERDRTEFYRAVVRALDQVISNAQNR